MTTTTATPTSSSSSSSSINTPTTIAAITTSSSSSAAAASMSIGNNHLAQQQQSLTKSSVVNEVNELTENLSSSIAAAAAMNFPAILGLKIRTINTTTNTQPQQQQQQQQDQPQQSHQISKPPPPISSSNKSNCNSLLKQQLRAGLKDIDVAKMDNAFNKDSNKSSNLQHQQQSPPLVGNVVTSNCCALQSLASVAERQLPNVIGGGGGVGVGVSGGQLTNSTNNNHHLHHQFLMHMAAAQTVTTTATMAAAAAAAPAQVTPVAVGNHQPTVDYFQLQQQQQQQQQQIQMTCASAIDDEMDFLLERNDKSDMVEHDLMLADENAGLEYRQQSNNDDNNGQQQQQQQLLSMLSSSTPSTATSTPDRSSSTTTTTTTTATTPKSSSQRTVQRRRVRRKAQSTNDDQAEHLTEMSVRGLDLFRYASISEGVYQCTECAKENMQKTFKNKYSFQRHAFLYHEGKHRKVFPCPVCSKEFSRPDKMKNHMKMTHENFVVPKDLNNFNPLNYLITAAAAGDIQAASIFQQQQQQQQQQQEQIEQFEQQIALRQEQQHQQQQQFNEDLQRDHHHHQHQNQHQQEQNNFESSAILFANEVKQEVEEEDHITNVSQPTLTQEATAAAIAMLTVQNDIIIKNELVISPTPSPPSSTMLPNQSLGGLSNTSVVGVDNNKLIITANNNNNNAQTAST